MAANRGWIKQTLQLVALVLVSWGIYHSVRTSAAQLARQREDLAEQAAELHELAKNTVATAQRLRLESEAARSERSARDFWQADAGGLLCAGIVYVLGMLPASLFWRACLKVMEQPAQWVPTLWAYFYGNLGKYFPGKAMVIVLRLAALDHLGIKKAATAMTIFMETLTMMSVGGAMAAVCLILLNIDWRLTALALGLLVMTFVPTAPPLLRYLLTKLQRGVDPTTLEAWGSRIHAGLFVRGWLLLSLTWIAFGLSLMLVLRSLPIADFSQTSSWTMLLSCFGACALAVVLGFVSLIPGGAGVREVVLSTVLTPVVGPVAALCGAVWLRIVWLAAELLMVGFLFVIKRMLP